MMATQHPTRPPDILLLFATPAFGVLTVLVVPEVPVPDAVPFVLTAVDVTPDTPEALVVEEAELGAAAVFLAPAPVITPAVFAWVNLLTTRVSTFPSIVLGVGKA
jgi:hypothetical protein